METLRDSALPLRVAKRMDSATFDALGFGVLVSSTLGEALQRIQRYLRFMTDGIRLDIETEGGVVSICLVQTERRAEHAFVDQVSLAHIVLSARSLTGMALRPLEVHFPYAPIADDHALRDFFRAPLVYGSPVTALRFASSVLELPLLRADAKMAAFFEAYLDRVLHKAYPEHGIAAKVRDALPRALAEHAYAPNELAAQLGMTRAMLGKQLRQEGSSYNELLVSVRRALAEYHLRQRKLSLGEIAYELGYSEPAAFHRAFRRWTQMTPAAFRASHFPDGSESGARVAPAKE